MRTSGRGGAIDSMLFVAPAVVFIFFFVWMSGSPLDAVDAVDRLVLVAVRTLLSLWDSVVAMIAK